MRVEHATIAVRGSGELARSFAYTDHNGLPCPVIARRGTTAYVLASPYFAKSSAGQWDEQVYRHSLARITPVPLLADACAGADIVVEAVYEELGLKVPLFREFDRLAPPHALLASNTAGLPITALASATDRPEQVIGWHWFQPCAVMRLVELVCHQATAQATRDAVVQISERCGKRPVVVNDQPWSGASSRTASTPPCAVRPRRSWPRGWRRRSRSTRSCARRSAGQWGHLS